MTDWEKYGTCPRCHRTMSDPVLCIKCGDIRNFVLDQIGEDLARSFKETFMIPNCPVCGLPLPARWPNDVRSIHEDCARPASPAPRQILVWASNEEWERVPLLPQPALLRVLKRVTDWASTHMVVNTRRCFLCAGPTKAFYNCLPVCAECHDRVARLPEIDASDALKTIDAVYALRTTPRPPHAQACLNRRVRHSYLIKVPTGYLQYDGTTGPNECLWTKAEVKVECASFKELGTPVKVTRVIEP